MIHYFKLVFLMLTSSFMFVKPQGCPTCPAGYTAMADGIRCAKVFPQTFQTLITFPAAEAFCAMQGTGGHLVSVRSSADIALLHATVGNLADFFPFWLGGNSTSTGVFSWTDGYPVFNQSFFRGLNYGSRPSTCMIFSGFVNGTYPGGLYYNRNCTGQVFRPFCEVSCPSSTTTSPGSGTGENDPHFVTFDGLKYDSQTTCPYILSQPCNRDTYRGPFWSIKAKNSQLPGHQAAMVTFIELSFHDHSYSADQATNHATINFKVDNAVKTLPYNDESVKAYLTGGRISIETNSGIKIQFGYARQRVTVPSLHNHGTGVLCGLLGDFDGDCSNDLVGRDGKVYAEPKKPACKQPINGPEGLKAEQFADTWIVEKTDGCILGAAEKN